MELTEKKLWFSLFGSVLSIFIGPLFIRDLPAIGLTLVFGGMLGLILIPHVIAILNEPDESMLNYGLTPRQQLHCEPKVLKYSIIEAAYKNEHKAAGVRKISVEITEE